MFDPVIALLYRTKLFEHGQINPFILFEFEDVTCMTLTDVMSYDFRET